MLNCICVFTVGLRTKKPTNENEKRREKLTKRISNRKIIMGKNASVDNILYGNYVCTSAIHMHITILLCVAKTKSKKKNIEFINLAQNGCRCDNQYEWNKL